jgi:hypothetical protein
MADTQTCALDEGPDDSEIEQRDGGTKKGEADNRK